MADEIKKVTNPTANAVNKTTPQQGVNNAGNQSGNFSRANQPQTQAGQPTGAKPTPTAQPKPQNPNVAPTKPTTPQGQPRPVNPNAPIPTTQGQPVGTKPTPSPTQPSGAKPTPSPTQPSGAKPAPTPTAQPKPQGEGQTLQPKPVPKAQKQGTNIPKHSAKEQSRQVNEGTVKAKNLRKPEDEESRKKKRRLLLILLILLLAVVFVILITLLLVKNATSIRTVSVDWNNSPVIVQLDSDLTNVENIKINMVGDKGTFSFQIRNLRPRDFK